MSYEMPCRNPFSTFFLWKIAKLVLIRELFDEESGKREGQVLNQEL